MARGSVENPRISSVHQPGEPEIKIVSPEYLLELLDDPCTAAEAVELAHRTGFLNGGYRRGTNPTQMIDELRGRLLAFKRIDQE